jgi:MerR family copper efflux transcriptional regulator
VIATKQRHRLPVVPDEREPMLVGQGAEAETGSEAGQELLLVGEVAKAAGKTVRAIHLYEDMGLLKPQDRSKGRYRLFLPDTVVRVRWITKLQNLGLTLAEIKELVREQQGSGSAVFAAARLREIYQSKLEETREKLRELRQLERELQASLEYLESCDSECVPSEKTDSCSSCSKHTEPSRTPELVAGVHAH